MGDQPEVMSHSRPPLDASGHSAQIPFQEGVGSACLLYPTPHTEEPTAWPASQGERLLLGDASPQQTSVGVGEPCRGTP